MRGSTEPQAPYATFGNSRHTTNPISPRPSHPIFLEMLNLMEFSHLSTTFLQIHPFIEVPARFFLQPVPRKQH